MTNGNGRETKKVAHALITYNCVMKINETKKRRNISMVQMESQLDARMNRLNRKRE